MTERKNDELPSANSQSTHVPSHAVSTSADKECGWTRLTLCQRVFAVCSIIPVIIGSALLTITYTHVKPTPTPSPTTLSIAQHITFSNGFQAMATLASGQEVRGRVERGNLFPDVSGPVAAFYGIRYAEPPVGKLRFQDPQPLRHEENPAESTVFDATHSSVPTCMKAFGKQMIGSEDCLKLDVWVPLDVMPPLHGFPVVVFIPGGGFVQNEYNSGIEIVSTSQSIIYVYVRYRTGPWGFLAHPSLSNQYEPVAHSGTQGFMDQVMALQFVRDNINGFGGDPHKVTLAGQSAGSWSVCLHMISPHSASLFRAAIGESGGCDALELLKTQSEAEQLGMQFADELACPGYGGQQLQCMLNAATETIHNATLALKSVAIWSENWFSPSIDGFAFTDWPAHIFRSGHFNAVPMLTGANYLENWVWTYRNFDYIQTRLQRWYTSPGITREGVQALKHYFQADNPYLNESSIVAQFTPPIPRIHPAQLADAQIEDSWLKCPNRRMARYAEAASRPSYLYVFRAVSNSVKISDRFNASTKFRGGPTHMAELPYAWGVWRKFDFDEPPNASELKLTRTMMQYWTNFIMTMDPSNSTGAASKFVSKLPVVWPRYSTELDNSVQFGDVVIDNNTVWLANNVFQHECGAWDKALPAANHHAMPHCAIGYAPHQTPQGNKCLRKPSISLQVPMSQLF